MIPLTTMIEDGEVIDERTNNLLDGLLDEDEDEATNQNFVNIISYIYVFESRLFIF